MSSFDRLHVDDVSRHFGRRRAVSHVTFTAPRHAIVGLLGPNGAGKSTMLAMLATLLRPTSGVIRYGTIDQRHHGASLRASIGVLGHDLFLYPELNARENLEFFGGLYGVPNIHAAANEALEHAGLLERANDQISTFSRGMRQRLALERALIHKPKLLLLDEPFTGLDDASGSALLARLRALRDSGAIIVLATHDLDLAGDLLDRAIFLRDGRMVDSADKPDALRAMYRQVMSGQSKSDVGVGQSKSDVGTGQSKLDVGTGQSKSDVRADQSKSDVGAGHSKSDVRAGQSKSDVGADQSKSDVGAGQSKSDVGVGQSKSDVGVGQSKSDAGAGQSKSDVGAGFSRLKGD